MGAQEKEKNGSKRSLSKKQKIIIIISAALIAAIVLTLSLSLTLTSRGGKPLDIPAELKAEGNVLQWNEVPGATGYILHINDITYELNECRFDFKNYNFLTGEYRIRVKAKGDGKKFADSQFCNEYIFNYSNDTLYTLNVITGDGGTTSIINAKDGYPANSLVQLVAYPQKGYHFDGWFSDDWFKLSSKTTFSFTINTNTIIRAQFSQNAENVNVGAQEETEMMGCSGDFAVYVHCPEDENYIRRNFFILDDYFLDDENNLLLGLTPIEQAAAIKELGSIERLNNNYYKIFPADTYEASGAYVAKATGSVTILKEMTRLGNGAEAQNSDGNLTASAQDEEGVAEMAFSIGNDIHSDIVLRRNVFIYSFADNVNANENNVDGWVVERIGTGHSDGENIGGFITEKIKVNANGIERDLKAGETDGDIIGFGGGLTRDKNPEFKDLENSVFGRVIKIQALGNELYPVYFVELAGIENEEDVFENLDIYAEEDVDLEDEIDPDDPVLLANIKKHFSQNEEFQKFLAGTYVAIDRYEEERHLGIKPMSVKSFLDDLKMDVKLKVDSSGVTVTINGKLEVDFGKSETEFGHSEGKITISFSMQERVWFGVKFTWVKNKIGFKKGFQVVLQEEDENKFTFDAKVTFSATTKQSRILVDKSTKCIHKIGCWHIKQMLEENKMKTDKSIIELEAEGYKPCGTCLSAEYKEYVDNVETDKFNETMSDVLRYRDWGETINEVIGCLKSSGNDETAEKDFLICDIPFNYVLTFHFKAYLHMSFSLEASLHYEHDVLCRTELGARVTFKEFKPFFSRTSETKYQELTLMGKMEAKVGLRVELSASTPLGSCELGIYGELGVYEELAGVLHLSSTGENYAAAYFEVGLYYDVGIYYRALWVIKGDKSLANDKIPFLTLGYDKVIYAYEYDINEVSVAASELKKEFTLNELNLLAVKNFKLPSMQYGSEVLDAESNLYVIDMKLTDTDWFELDGKKIKVKDGAPFGTKFEGLLTISVKSVDKAWHKYIKGAAAVYLPTIQVKLICELECSSHNFIYLSQIDPDCTNKGYKECMLCTRCYKEFSMAGELLESREAIDAFGHNYVKLPSVAPDCVTAGLSEGSQCDRCGHIGVEQTVIAAKGHDLTSDNWQTLKEASCLSQGLSGNVCNDCNQVFQYEVLLPTGHTVDPTHDKPTCTEGVFCEVCNAELAEAKGHYYGDPIQTVAPGCETVGYYRYKCHWCELPKDEEIPATGHSKFDEDSEYRVSKEATCEEAGERTYKCKKCDKELTLPIPPAGHIYNNEKWTVDTEPTCETQGEKSIHCIVCGKRNENSATAIPALGHDYRKDNYTTDIQPTCTLDGIKSIHCSREGCDSRNEQSISSIPATGHDYTVWSQTKAPDCNTDGEEERHCTRDGCGISETRAVHALGHDLPDDGNVCRRCHKEIEREHTLQHLTEIRRGKDPTCLENGYTDGVWCFACARYISGHAEISAPDNHNLITVSAREADCIQIGWEEYCYCGNSYTDEHGIKHVCGYTTYVEIPVNINNHALVTVDRVEATCISEGNEEYSYCARIGCLHNKEALEQENVIPVDKNAHDFHTVAAKPATCLADGWKAYNKCDRCGYDEYNDETKNVREERGSNGHTSLHNIEGRAPTCTEDGWNAYEYCDYSYTDEEGETHTCVYTTYEKLDKTNHKNRETVQSVPCRVSEDGWGIITGRSQYEKCLDCNEYYYSQLGVSTTEAGILEIVTAPHKGHKLSPNGVVEEGGCDKYRKVRYLCQASDVCADVVLDVYDRGNPSDMHQGYNVGINDKLVTSQRPQQYCQYCSKNGLYVNLGLKYKYLEAEQGYALIGIGSAIPDDNGKITVPATYMGKPVLYIGEDIQISGFAAVSEIALPATIKEIKTGAFSGYVNLSAVSFYGEPKSGSTIKIGHQAFFGCTNLTTANLPKNLRELGNDAFSKTRLRKVVLSSSLKKIMSSAFKDCEYLTNVEMYKVDSFESNVFENCINLSEIRFYGAIESWRNMVAGAINWDKNAGTEIDERLIMEGMNVAGYVVHCDDGYVDSDGNEEYFILFELCNNNTAYQVVGLRGDYANNETNRKLYDVSIPSEYKNKNVISIKARAFAITSVGNDKINRTVRHIIIPESVTHIEAGAFHGCLALESVTIPFVGTDAASTTASEETLFGAIFGTYAIEGFAAVEQKYGVTAEGAPKTRTYYLPEKLKKVTITGNNNILYGAFSNCTMLEEIVLADNIKNINIDSTAFESCNIKIVRGSAEVVGYLAQSVRTAEEAEITCGTEIPNGAFDKCGTLKKIIIPKTIVGIGGYAFGDCTGLTGVYISDLSAWCQIKFGYEKANPLCYAHNLYLNGELLTELTIPESVTEINDYVFLGINIKKLIIPKNVKTIGRNAFYRCLGMTELIMSEGVQTIGPGAFSHCESLTELTIPEGVTLIDDYAFVGCSNITRVTIPGSVKTIGRSAFEDCLGMTELIMSEGIQTIGEYAFRHCESLTELTIPEGVTSIRDRAFCDCKNITRITISTSVTKVGIEAFWNCHELTTFIYDGTIAQWKATTGRNSGLWGFNTGDYIIYCTDGTITKKGTETYY